MDSVINKSPNAEKFRESLERRIKPCYDIIKVYLSSTKRLLLSSSTRKGYGLSKQMSNIAPNISVLRALGVPEGTISSSAASHSFMASLEPEKFRESFKKVMNTGFCPSAGSFVKAVHALAMVDASKWAQKVEFYRKWGWSEDDFLLAFRKSPAFMYLTEKNFSSKMEFLVNKMGWQPADVRCSCKSNYSNLLFGEEDYLIPKWWFLVQREDNYNKTFQ